MKRVFLILALGLGLALVTGDSAWAGITPDEYYDNPGGTGDAGGENGDHPWGGDRIIGGGDTDQKTTVVSVSTGYRLLDAIILRVSGLLVFESSVSPRPSTQTTVTVDQTRTVRPVYYDRINRVNMKGVGR